MTEPTVLASGLAMGESPRWHDDRLWVCDWVAEEVLTFDDDGNRKVVRTVPWLPFSIDWLPDGRLVVTSGSGRQVWREEPDGSLTPYGGLDRMWNEVVVDGRGNTFVNEIGFDMMAGAPPAAGTVAVVRSDGAMREVADDLWFPNGMAITPDDTTLIVAESYGNRLTAFDIGPDGDLGGRRVWAGLGDAAPDGICLDAEGAVWFADVPHRRCVRVREAGGAAGRRRGPGLLRLHARGRRRPHPVHRGDDVGPERDERRGRPHRADPQDPRRRTARGQALTADSV